MTDFAFDKSGRTIDADGLLHVKQCSKCNKVKSINDFSKRKKSKDGLQKKCKLCAKKEKTKWYLENKDKVSDYNKEYSVLYREKNKEYIAANKKEYHEKNKAVITKKVLLWQINNKEKVNEKNRMWSKKNPIYGYFKSSGRRAAKKKAIPKWADNKKIKEIYKLAKELTLLTGEKYNVDHIVPLQSPIVCGLHWECNLQVITQSENFSKSNKYWDGMP